MGLVNAPPLGHFFDANPHLIPTQGWGLGGDLYPSVKLTALLCFPKHTKHCRPFLQKPHPWEKFLSQSPTLMRVGGGGGGGGGFVLIGALHESEWNMARYFMSRWPYFHELQASENIA